MPRSLLGQAVEIKFQFGYRQFPTSIPSVLSLTQTHNYIKNALNGQGIQNIHI